jgi:hypothetical protein
LPIVGFGEDHLDRTDRPWGVDDHQSPRDTPAEGHQHPCAGPRKAHLVDQQPDQPPPRPQWLVREAVWGRGWRGRRSSPRSNRDAPDGDLGRLDVARTHTRMALVTASPKPGPARRQPRPGWRQAAAASWFARHAKAQQGKSPGGSRDVQLLFPAGATAVMTLWGVLQAWVVQLRHRAGVGAAWHQPSYPRRQRPPAGNLMAGPFSYGATPARP